MYNVCVNYVDVCIFMGDGGVDYWQNVVVIYVGDVDC